MPCWETQISILCLALDGRPHVKHVQNNNSHDAVRCQFASQLGAATHEVHVWLLRNGLTGCYPLVWLKLWIKFCSNQRFWVVDMWFVHNLSSASSPHMEIGATFCLTQPLHVIIATTAYMWVCSLSDLSFHTWGEVMPPPSLMQQETVIHLNRSSLIDILHFTYFWLLWSASFLCVSQAQTAVTVEIRRKKSENKKIGSDSYLETVDKVVFGA